MQNNNHHFKQIIQFKRELDKLAELSWQENKTKDYIITQLSKNYFWSEKTAVVYTLGQGLPVFFRAELDALPSPHGPKHLCGHSAHTAALMGAYLYLKNNPPQNFTIYFIFQPAEESWPSGADFVIKNLPIIKKCRAGFAIHVFPNFPAGELVNPHFAAGDYFEIEIISKSGHVKDKNNIPKNADALMIAADLIKKINGSRRKDSVINIGIIKGGETPNKIASLVNLSGDARALKETARQQTYQWLKNICAKHSANLRYFRGFPPLINNDNLLMQAKKYFNIKSSTQSFACEDFALYPVPYLFLLIGTGAKTELHTDNFKVSDKIVEKIFEYWLKLEKNLEQLTHPDIS